GNEGVLQPLRVASNNCAQKIVHSLEDDRMVAREILESQVRPLASHGIEEHCAPDRSVWSSALVVDGEEGGEAVRGILFHARERKIELADDGVTHLVPKNELVGPHIQDVSCEVLLRDRLRRTLALHNLR